MLIRINILVAVHLYNYLFSIINISWAFRVDWAEPAELLSLVCTQIYVSRWLFCSMYYTRIRNQNSLQQSIKLIVEIQISTNVSSVYRYSIHVLVTKSILLNLILYSVNRT